MNWGKSIALAFVLFAGFIATLVTVCVRQDINLVSKDYYKEELNYGEQIKRLENTNTLATKPTVVETNGTLVVTFADFEKVSDGELKLFRPSDARLDKTFALPIGSGDTRVLDVSNIPGGMYKFRMKWTMNQSEYYFEEVINL